MPSAKKLAEDIADRFLASKFKNKPLMRVAELAQSQAGSNVLNQWLRDYFDPFEATLAHESLPNFRWRAIATTNYDLLVEKAYRQSKSKLQTLVSRVKDDQPIETMLSEQPNPLEYLKLHGCIDYVHDKEIPLVLTPDSYNSHDQNRRNLYARLESYGREFPIIFCGHSLEDLHIRRLVDDPASSSRPYYYLVSPDFEPEETSMWADRRVETVAATFSKFMQALERDLPPLMRVPPRPANVLTKAYRKHFRVTQNETDQTQQAFEKDFEHIHADVAVGEVSAERFYSGYDQTWGAIRRNLDVHRRVSHQLLEYIGTSQDTTTQIGVIRAPAGYGKTIALKRAAWELAASFGEFVIWLDDAGRLRPEVMQEIHDLTGKRLYVFIDRAALNLPKIDTILAASAGRKVPLTLLTAERTNEWSIYCQRLEKYGPTFFDLRKLSEREIEELLEKLEMHRCLGALQTETKDKRREIIKSRLDRELLIVLHEVTKGKPFEEIVEDEYRRLSPPEAQELYLDICTLNRFDTAVRAGVISRIGGVSFRDFGTELFEPLQELVVACQNAITGDYEYRTRHPLVAEMVFSRVCRTDEARRDQLLRMIDGLDIGYSSDELALSGILRGRTLAETFEDVVMARDVYEVAAKRNPSRAFIHQQKAILEYSHIKGDLETALTAVETAADMEPRSASIRHTLAEVLRRKAFDTSSEFARRTFRMRARNELDQISDQNNAYVLSTRARLHVDDVSDAISRLGNKSSDAENEELAATVDRAEIALQRALNMHPNDPDVLAANAKLRDLLGDTPSSTQLLERAWRKMPRGSGVARTLSLRYLETNEPEKWRSIFLEALERDPSDRAIHLLLAQLIFLYTKDVSNAEAEQHLKRSFVAGDREYFARFVCSAYTFARYRYDECFELIDDIQKRAPADFKPSFGSLESWLEPALQSRNGVVTKNFGSYMFIKIRDCPREIYAPSSRTTENAWDSVQVHSSVEFDVTFLRRGPVAISLRRSD